MTLSANPYLVFPIEHCPKVDPAYLLQSPTMTPCVPRAPLVRLVNLVFNILVPFIPSVYPLRRCPFHLTTGDTHLARPDKHLFLLFIYLYSRILNTLNEGIFRLSPDRRGTHAS